ncbi:MAG: winged helix-turn-helix transcriptional regulator [Pedobacter sp.]
MEEYGIVSRKVFAEVPPRVEYSLTEKGKALKNVLIEMKSWGDRFLTA